MEKKIKNLAYEKLSPEYKFIVDEVMKNLDEGAGLWRAGWQMPRMPESAITKKQYRGVNNFCLTLVAMAKGYGDHRWATFRQIEEKGWSFKKDEEGNSLGKGAGV
ncbi:MAG: ArdC-like ssDNA-binding domain-containing protein, partial [Candidatus Coproplasma sp.]